ncbi:MAG TPA: TetR/AcrR family transcriptional regulator [Aldersonia sp.]
MLGTPTRNRVAERREETRREILDAAWSLVREDGLAQLTLRRVAERVGMRAPSLYTHFASKNDIYDAMFGQAWAECLDASLRQIEALPAGPRARLRGIARGFFDFSVNDLPRFQLMNQRVIPDFEPSATAYAPSLQCMQMLRNEMGAIGIVDDADVDLYVVIVGGLVDGQFANDPGGTRYARLLDRAIDMYADNVGLPTEETNP